MSTSTTKSLKVLDWEPTSAQRVAKARFYNAASTAWRPIESYSRDDIARLSGAPKAVKWLDNPEFTAWFFNADLAKQKILAHAETAVDELVHILENRCMDPRKGGASAAAKVRAAEIVMQYAGLQPAKRIEQTNKLDNMSSLTPDQLREYLSDNVKSLLRQLPPEQVREIIGQDQLERALLSDVGGETGSESDRQDN